MISLHAPRYDYRAGIFNYHCELNNNNFWTVNICIDFD